MKKSGDRHVLVTFEVCKRIRQLEYKTYKEFASSDVGPGHPYKNPADYLNAQERKCYNDDGPMGKGNSRQIAAIQIF